jgi:uracil-DNA glycosylase
MSAIIQQKLERLVTALRACTLCPKMHRPAVSGGAVLSRVMSVGQAPGVKEPVMGRPFAWTAGKTLFKWFTSACGWSEADFRSRIYMAAVARCFPGKAQTGGDRVPDEGEVNACSRWLAEEIDLLRPELVLPIGKLAIAQFVPFEKTDRSHRRRISRDEIRSSIRRDSAAASQRREHVASHGTGKSLLEKALRRVVGHPAWPKGE